MTIQSRWGWGSTRCPDQGGDCWGGEDGVKVDDQHSDSSALTFHRHIMPDLILVLPQAAEWHRDSKGEARFWAEEGRLWCWGSNKGNDGHRKEVDIKQSWRKLWTVCWEWFWDLVCNCRKRRLNLRMSCKRPRQSRESKRRTCKSRRVLCSTTMIFISNADVQVIERTQEIAIQSQEIQRRERELDRWLQFCFHFMVWSSHSALWL